MSARTSTLSSPIFVMAYDLRDAAAWQRAHEHRCLWGRLYTDYHVLDQDHVLLVFRSAAVRWERWEQARMRDLGRT
jgi:hypothetical protein